jgi:antitoxin CptB
MNDPLELLRKKLFFRAHHRGTKEMDVILGSFARENIAQFSQTELNEFSDLLEQSDPDLYNWITGVDTPPPQALSDILQRFLAEKTLR